MLRSTVLVVLLIFVFLIQAAAASDSVTNTSHVWKTIIEIESRTGGDKFNLIVGGDQYDAYVLLTEGSLELELGGPFSLFGVKVIPPRLGGVWRADDNRLHPQAAINFFLEHGLIAVRVINEMPLDKVPEGIYQEGFVGLRLNDLFNGGKLGMFCEHYRNGDDEDNWVLGSMFAHYWEKGIMKEIALWWGFTDNPTAAINVTFGFDW